MELIRDKIVLGIANENTQSRLRRERDLTIDEAIETCQATELTDMRMKTMEQERPLINSVNATARQQYSRTGSPKTTNQNDYHPSMSTNNCAACKYCSNAHKHGKMV